MKSGSQKRQVSSCIPCYTKKQKCNREYPCFHCTRRRRPDECTYHHQPPRGDQTPALSDAGHSEGLLPAKRRCSSELLDCLPAVPSIPPAAISLVWEGCPPVTSSLIAQLGYFEESNRNTLAVIRHLGLNPGSREDTSVEPLIPSDATEEMKHLLKQMPERRILNTLVQYFVAEVEWIDRLIYPAMFLAQYQEWWTTKDHLTTVADLDLAVLILRISSYASQFLPAPSYTLDCIHGALLPDIRASCDGVATQLTTLARRLDAGGSLSRVQPLCFHGLTCQSENRMVCFWGKLSEAVRVAQWIGLGHDSRQDHAGELTKEMRRRTFCNLYIWDNQLAQHLDRSPFLSAPSTTPTTPNHPEGFTSRLLQARLADFWRRTTTVPYSMLQAEEQYDQFCLEFLSHLPPAFALPSPSKTWDKRLPKLPHQRLLVHIAIFESLCSHFRPLLLLLLLLPDKDTAFLPAYKALLLATQRKALAVAAVQVLKAVHTLHALLGASHTRFAALIIPSSIVVVLTSCGLARARNPDGAVMTGLLRVLGLENPSTQFVSIDLDADDFAVADSEVSDLVQCIVDQEAAPQQPPEDEAEGDFPTTTSGDREFVWQDGCLWVSRLVPDDDPLLSTSALEPQPLDSQGPVKAAFEMPGVASSLYFTPYRELWQPLPPDHIDVQVAAVGLSTQDLDVWAGRVDSNHLSYEYSGVVTATGAQVTEVQVGDRVYGLGPGQFGTHTRVPAALACPATPSDDLVAMASLPQAYALAVYAFEHLALLRPGHTVLIHGPVDGLSLAAITLARSKGAAVSVVADSEHGELALRTLVNEAGPHGILTTAPHTGQFDVIWSLRPQTLDALTPLVAPLGHLVVVDSRPGSLHPHHAHVSYLDPHALFAHAPALTRELLQTPCTVPDISGLPSALRDLPSTPSKHLVTFTQPDHLIRMSPPTPTLHFDPSARYIITGGLGGLGRAIVRWMASRGARHLTILSRRAAAAETTLTRLRSQGITIEALTCDITNQPHLHALLTTLSTSGPPIRGLIHAAVSYLDLTFTKLTPSRWQDSLSAKPRPRPLPLDFFVMTTSLLSVYALATQSAYTAANNFQDAFARYRHALGLAASAVSFSLIRDASSVDNDPATIDTFARNRTLTLSEDRFLERFEAAFLPPTQHPHPLDPLSSANLLTCRRRKSSARSNTARLRRDWDTAIAAAKADPQQRPAAITFVTRAIVAAVAEMLFIEPAQIDPERSVADHGVDSLIAAELRNWFVLALGVRISSLGNGDIG
ncbi:KR-domain-containing protein [Aspergillus ellipticus CBS 707.79]|uniref:KR-domain-containing protein n=1 Tax=Aspergillus ellipticus CBS 707.79 TaxID=1448320 RepID=A0A319CRB9_9EURO|nr:KR-domain-containing protein [Aspergillus ellipticus CBS 707.79]